MLDVTCFRSGRLDVKALTLPSPLPSCQLRLSPQSHVLVLIQAKTSQGTRELAQMREATVSIRSQLEEERMGETTHYVLS